MQLNDSITHEIAHLTGRMGAIIRAQAGELFFHHLDQMRRLAATTRHHGDRAGLWAKRALINHLRVTVAYQPVLCPSNLPSHPTSPPASLASARGR